MSMLKVPIVYDYILSIDINNNVNGMCCALFAVCQNIYPIMRVKCIWGYRKQI